MANFPRPTEYPRWADVGGGAGIVVPSLGQQNTGWVLNQVPPSNFWNWMQNRNYGWLRYLDEKLGASGAAEWGRFTPTASTGFVWQAAGGDPSTGNIVYGYVIGGTAPPKVLPLLAGVQSGSVATLPTNAAPGTAILFASNNAGRFVVCYSSPTPNYYQTIHTSDDGGQTWTNRYLGNAGVATNGVSGLAYLNGVVWIATFAPGGADLIYTSPDGVTWTQRTNPSTGARLWPAWNGTVYALVGTRVATSPDAATWTDRGVFYSSSGAGACAAINGLFVASKIDGRLYTSPDGITWTLVASVPAVNGGTATWDCYTFNGICYCFAWNIYSATASCVAWTRDGSVWNLMPIGITINVANIAGVLGYNGRAAYAPTVFGGTAETIQTSGPI